MVLYHLDKKGYSTTAIDRRNWLDDRVKDTGVKFIKGDMARAIPTANEYDFVYSYNSMEHFPDPEIILRECIRVTKKDGLIFFSFGPLFYSPRGLHAYRMISIPYCQFLFSEETIQRFLDKHFEGEKISELYDVMNKWPIRKYRELWKKYEDQLKVIKYHEGRNANAKNIIEQYPQCFKKGEDYFTSSIDILFKKR